MSGENWKSMSNGPQYNPRYRDQPKYEAFLQNKEFVEWLAKNVKESNANIAEAIKQFKVEMPHIKLPEFNTVTIEEELNNMNYNMALMIEEQRATNDYIKQLIEVMQHVAGVKKPRNTGPG